MQQIYQDAHVSASSFQNLFRCKEGVLLELTQFMFKNQFSMARASTGAKLPPTYVYAVETAIQLTLTELNENLREIYIEAYTGEKSLTLIQNATAKELFLTFGPRMPYLSEMDFLALEYGSAGLMRGYMANPCTLSFPLEKKIRSFLMLALRGYCVPEEEVQQIIHFVESLDIRAIAQKVMESLFHALAMHYHFSLSGILPEETEAEDEAEA